MTLLRNVVDDAAGVHALVIGVGTYPHLEGGKKARFPDTQGMGQLGSPPKSAAAVTDWLLTEHAVAGRPLKSIDVLVSGPSTFQNEAGAAQKAEAATFARVRDAVRAWKARGARHPDNLLIFYFCGHGVSTGAENSLLLEDFGGDLDDPFSAAIDTSKLLTGMRKCAATRQVYLIDACRTVQDDYLENYANSGSGLIDAAAHTNLGAVQQAVIWSTSLGSQAFGNAKAPSLFASGMLKALRGAAAALDDDGSWVVKPLSLKAGLDVIMQRLAPNVEQIVSVDHVSKDFPFHYMPGAPKVPASIRCEPLAFMPRSTLVCTSANGFSATRDPLPDERWDLELDVGDYEFKATVAAGNAAVGSQKVTVFPPGRKVAIVCKEG